MLRGRSTQERIFVSLPSKQGEVFELPLGDFSANRACDAHGFRAPAANCPTAVFKCDMAIVSVAPVLCLRQFRVHHQSFRLNLRCCWRTSGWDSAGSCSRPQWQPVLEKPMQRDCLVRPSHGRNQNCCNLLWFPMGRLLVCCDRERPAPPSPARGRAGRTTTRRTFGPWAASWWS